MTLLLLIILGMCILGGFFFAGVETGFVSWNPLKIGYRARQGNIIAQWALYLIQHKERVLSMVLIGNNTCIVGASLSFLFLFNRLNQLVTIDLERIPSPETWFLSPVIVVFSEMLPKSLFRIYSFRLTIKSIPLLMMLYWTTLPLTWIFSAAGSLFQKKIRKSREFVTSVRKEMVLIAQEGSRRGTLFEYAVVIVDTILNLNEKTVEDIIRNDTSDETDMKKRVKVSDTVALICHNGYLSDNNDLLVFDTDGDTVAGWVALLDIAKADADTEIKTIMKSLPEISENTSLLSFFRKKRESCSPFYRIIDKNRHTNGILNNFSTFRVVFSGYNTI